MRFHGVVPKAFLWHAEPASIRLARQGDGRAVGAVERGAVAVEAGAGPGRDDNGQRAIGAGRNFGVGEI